MTSYSSLWLPLAHLCFLWLPMAPYVSVWVCSGLYGSLWVHMDLFDSLWFPITSYSSLYFPLALHIAPMALYGYLWRPIVPYGSLWLPMAPFSSNRSVRVCMGPYGSLGIPMASYCFLWLPMTPNGFLGKPSTKKREIVVFFYQRGLPPPLKFGPISFFFLGKNGKSFRGLVFPLFGKKPNYFPFFLESFRYWCRWSVQAKECQF